MFGSIAKVYVTQDSSTISNETVLSDNRLALSLYVLALNNEGQLVTASRTLKENLKIINNPHTLVLFESPHRLLKLLSELKENLPEFLKVRINLKSEIN